ncbi:Multidrug resistance protein PmpM [Saliniradius amylolyticus]|uniref:Multidrug-efflux transporter n=1 Tax=Saliniradius amylolyticus TaxID=2183582 RepID=A0A2S2E2B5_9ALTE|nr:MATE family efflux transporter [Saliniradius amylolyticus]AWL11796.1 Multidrug resistance protein PmpM [Saliniradius amylolyticus]
MLKTEIRQLLKLAWPLLIAQVTQTLMGVSDTIMAGQVSASDMAAVAIAGSIIMPILFFLQGIILALPPIISRLNGAGQSASIPNQGQQMLWLSLLLSLPLAAGYFYIPYCMQWLTMEAELKAITTEYMQYLALGIPGFVAYQVFRQYCEGLSVTRPSMVIMVMGLLVNIAANYVFIYGKLGLPAFGGAGCGIATSIVFAAMMVATWWYTLRSPRLQAHSLYRRFYRPSLSDFRAQLGIGLPIALTILFEVSLFALVAVLLAPFGAEIVASHQIALNFSSLAFMVPLSIGFATSIRIGHLLGEGRPANARKAVYGAWITGLSAAVFTASLSLLLRYPIANLYSNNAEVVNMAANLMFLAAVFQFSDAIQVISGCALRGYKDTKAMFYISFVSYWMVGLTTGCVLGLTDWIVEPMAAEGFWIGFITGLTAAAIFLGWRLMVVQKRLRSTPSQSPQAASA